MMLTSPQGVVRTTRAAALFRTSSFMDGLAEVFNLPGFNHISYKTSATANEADSRAAVQDWAAYGDDLRTVCAAVEL